MPLVKKLHIAQNVYGNFGYVLQVKMKTFSTCKESNRFKIFNPLGI